MSELDVAEQALARADEAEQRLDIDGVIAHLSTAVRNFTAADRPCEAAMACVRLGDLLGNALGHLAAGRAWFTRARRLIDHQPECIEQGWVAVAPMGCDVDDPDQLLIDAELALVRARTFDDVALEAKALADGGLAHVQSGRLDVGMAQLDEAMALACGSVEDDDVVAKSVCSFFTACYYSSDFDRAARWAELFHRRGIIGSDAPRPLFLSSHCDSVQATLLMEIGRWGEAETVLVASKERFEALLPIPAWHPAIALADLRVRQGRLAEAEALLLGKDQAMQALLPAVRLHLARRDPGLARIAAQRGLRVLAEDRLRVAELLISVVDAELLAGEIDAAEAALEQLLERIGELDVPTLQARTAQARARVAAARGTWHDAVAHLDAGLDVLAPTQLDWLRLTLMVDLVRARRSLGQESAARADALAALSVLERLDVVLDRSSITLLEHTAGGGPTRDAGVDATRRATLRVDDSGVTVHFEGVAAKLRRSKGLRYLAELVAHPGVERHVLDLVDLVEGLDERRLVDRRRLGDAGAAVDATARAQYRRRVEQLRAEADAAIAAGELDRAIALQDELDQLVAQLAAAFGLDGAARSSSSAAERARLNVTRSLRTAVSAIDALAPLPAAVLDRSLRTGRYCVYEPSSTEPVRWYVEP